MKRGSYVAVMLLLLGAGGVGAQEPGARPGSGRPREELFKMVDAYIVSNLQESLGLSDAQFVKVLPLVKKLQSDRRGYFERRHQALQEMRRLLESGRATETRIAELLSDVKGIESEEPAALRRDVEALDAVLTPMQQAKLRVLQVQIEQKLRELDRKSTRLNSSHIQKSRMPSSA